MKAAQKSKEHKMFAGYFMNLTKDDQILPKSNGKSALSNQTRD